MKMWFSLEEEEEQKSLQKSFSKHLKRDGYQMRNDWGFTQKCLGQKRTQAAEKKRRIGQKGLLGSS